MANITPPTTIELPKMGSISALRTAQQRVFDHTNRLLC